MPNEMATIQSSNEMTLVSRPQPVNIFGTPENFAFAARMAKAFTSSALVPKHYRGEENLGSVLIAIDLANRLDVSPLMVMQNMSPIEGKPAWSSKFLIAAVNASGRFTPLRFKFERDEKPHDVEWTDYVWGDGKRPTPTKKVAKDILNRRCRAYATDLRTGLELEGPEVSIVMAIQERWYFRNGSKWPTMGELMLSYRAASLWTGIFAPEQTMGLPTADDAADAIDVTPERVMETKEPEVASGLDSLSARARELREKETDAGPTEPEPTPAPKEAKKAPEDDADADVSGEWPRAAPNGVLYDARGVTHIPGCHSGGKTCNRDGSWRLRKGVAEVAANAMEARYPRVDPKSLEAPPPPDDEPGEAFAAPTKGGDNDGPSYDDALEWIASADTTEEVDGGLDAARDLDLSEGQRADLVEYAEKRRAELMR